VTALQDHLGWGDLVEPGTGILTSLGLSVAADARELLTRQECWARPRD
jgi:hypothetical protein